MATPTVHASIRRLLRGVSTMNAKLPQLKACVRAGRVCRGQNGALQRQRGVRRPGCSSERTVERKAEAAMQDHLGRTFFTIVRRADTLEGNARGRPLSPSSNCPRTPNAS